MLRIMQFAIADRPNNIINNNQIIKQLYSDAARKPLVPLLAARIFH